MYPSGYRSAVHDGPKNEPRVSYILSCSILDKITFTVVSQLI